MSESGVPLTACARDAVKAALRVAANRHADDPTTEDLLLGLMEQRSALVIRMLEQLGVYLPVIEHLQQGERNSSALSASVAIKVAVSEATARNNPFLGAEHLLWGLVDDSALGSADIFERLGVRSDVRSALVALLDEPGAA